MSISRRLFLQSTAAALLSSRVGGDPIDPPLEEFSYGDVQLAPGPAQTQFAQTQSVLLALNEDSLLKPWRLRAGLPAPGPDLGGWYDELPLDKTPSGGHGFAPGHSFGQWLSALSRGYATDRDPAAKARLQRLLALYEPAISGSFYANFRFPAYNYDKLVIGLIDAHRFADLPEAYRLLEKTTDAAESHLPPNALDRDEPQRRWRASIGESTSNDYTWDESYTLPENLYLAWQRGAGERYRTLARRFLLDPTWFDPLSENENVLGGHHAYSFCNSLSSAMQAYLSDGSTKHLRAAMNAFDMISTTQSFVTGGWGPNESFGAPGSGALYASLTSTHRGFETPCGSYAHAKLTRYLLRVTRDGRYGDSLERVVYNTVLGAKRLEPNGRAFYYSDYHSPAAKVYFPDPWPCCSGTLPQVAADYHVMTYFRDPAGVFVNLYLPSALRWTNQDGVQLSLEQSGDYPVGNKIKFRVRAARPSRFSLRLRVPVWSTALVRVNGERESVSLERGFLTIDRLWREGDRVELTLILPLRLETIDSEHPNTVALVRGPLVLFAIANEPLAVTRQELLAAKKVGGEAAWRTKSSSGPLILRPFSAIEEDHYLTYLSAP
jgi:uncharacterized protein